MIFHRLCKVLTALAIIMSYEGVAQSLQKPNVIIILTDDQGYVDVGFNGSTEIPTPNIDRIAANGTVFSSGYVSYAVCGPSRAGLLTGRYQDRFGFGKNPLFAPNDSTMGLDRAEQTLADYLKQANYTTSIIGKWHLGAHPSLRPNERGFDEFFGFLSGGHDYFPENLVFEDEYAVKRNFDAYRTKLLRNHQRVEETEYLTDAFSREALSFIERNQDNPFFLYLAYNAPHAPMQATEKYLKRFTHISNEKRRTYAAMISAVDDGVGAMLDLLEKLKLEENTLVFFLSDNGGPPENTDNSPLRGYKGSFFEGGVRVPFAAQWKGTIPESCQYEHPVISLDIYGTVAALIGLETKNELDGVNLLPYLKGENMDVPHEALYWRNFNAGRFAIRTAQDKMTTEPDNQFLFDIRHDVSEKNNLAPANIGKMNELNQKIEAWKDLLKDPVFMGLMEDKAYSELHPDRFERKIENK
ncbi:MAG: sulfatase-like hydrolase/transferase [Cyclobacteriaceae bacterium]|nr:sulfatase-like hydrolase/transferase [Cyclobacteriaceae bacterium]